MVKVTGPRGKLSKSFTHMSLDIYKIDDNTIKVNPLFFPTQQRQAQAKKDRWWSRVSVRVMAVFDAGGERQRGRRGSGLTQKHANCTAAACP